MKPSFIIPLLLNKSFVNNSEKVEYYQTSRYVSNVLNQPNRDTNYGVTPSNGLDNRPGYSSDSNQLITSYETTSTPVRVSTQFEEFHQILDNNTSSNTETNICKCVVAFHVFYDKSIKVPSKSLCSHWTQSKQFFICVKIFIDLDDVYWFLPSFKINRQGRGVTVPVVGILCNGFDSRLEPNAFDTYTKWLLSRKAQAPFAVYRDYFIECL